VTELLVRFKCELPDRVLHELDTMRRVLHRQLGTGLLPTYGETLTALIDMVPIQDLYREIVLGQAPPEGRETTLLQEAAHG